MAKRGRKRKNNMYFGPEQEEAVIKFLESNDQRERNEIYNKWLRLPLDKMIESIIRRYKLYRKSISFEELHADTLSFLMTKADKFESAKNKKAYSYYGTICKHYILGLLVKDDKILKQNASYEELATSLDNEIKLSYNLEIDKPTINPIIQNIIYSIEDTLKEGEFKHDNFIKIPEKDKLTKDETKVGNMLIELLTNWEDMFDEMEGGKKFNKITILSALREGTNLSTKDIRVAMKRYKELYSLVKTDLVENDKL